MKLSFSSSDHQSIIVSALTGQIKQRNGFSNACYLKMLGTEPRSFLVQNHMILPLSHVSIPLSKTPNNLWLSSPTLFPAVQDPFWDTVTRIVFQMRMHFRSILGHYNTGHFNSNLFSNNSQYGLSFFPPLPHTELRWAGSPSMVDPPIPLGQRTEYLILSSAILGLHI